MALDVIAGCGALGARVSQGNGVIKISKNELPYQDRRPEESKLRKSISSSVNSPTLTDFFFYKFHLKFSDTISKLINKKVFWTHAADHKDFKDNWETWEKLWEIYHFLPIAFHIRGALRGLESDKNKRHEVFGEAGKGSRVFVSHGYKIDDRTVEVRIWGYEVGESIKSRMKKELEDRLKEKLFSEGEHLESCALVEEKAGKELVEGLK